jgi:hypothetical protein
MELVAVSLARLITYIQFQEWDPLGKTLTLEAFQAFALKYSFSQYPKSYNEIDFDKGIDFVAGRLDEVTIDKLSIHTNGIMIDTRSSTDSCIAVLADIIEFAREEFGSNIRPNRQNLVSNLIFRSDLSLLALSPVLAKISQVLRGRVAEMSKYTYVYEPSSIAIGPDISQSRFSPAAFTIERRAEIPFSENMYFSAAPVSTTEHIALIKEIEEALLSPV